jgi:hypothetical protein
MFALHGQRHTRTPWPQGIGIAAALAVVVGVIVLAFSWPGVTAEPHGLPIAIAAPAPKASAAESGAPENGAPEASAAESSAPESGAPEASAPEKPGPETPSSEAPGEEAGLLQMAGEAISPVPVSDRAAAVTAINHREVYGAIILGPQPEVLTSSAASPVVAQMLAGLVPRIQEQAALAAQTASAQEPTVTITDVVPLLEADSRGAGMTAASVPLVLGGLLGGIGIALAVVGLWRRIIALFAYAGVAGLLIAGILQGWFGVLGGHYLANAGVLAACLAAMGATIVGLRTLLGIAGIPIGPIVFLLIANPIAGVAMPREFLPGPWGDIGQWFPPGAGATLLRCNSYFPSAPSAFPWAILAGWMVLGLALVAVGHWWNAARREPAEAGAVAG